jgi:hypothetical protein
MSRPTEDREAISYYELQRRRDGLPERGEEKIGGDVSSLPPLPSTSPWSTTLDPEPLIDRSEDADHFIPPSTEGDN